MIRHVHVIGKFKQYAERFDNNVKGRIAALCFDRTTNRKVWWIFPERMARDLISLRHKEAIIEGKDLKIEKRGLELTIKAVN